MTIYEVIRKAITEKIDSHTEYLIGGGPKNFPEYVGAQARIRAYREVLNEVDQLEQANLEDDDNE